MDTHYDYEPWFDRDDDSEIPSFTVYLNGEPIAFTNEHRPEADQEEAARMLTASWQLLAALERLERAMKKGDRGERIRAAKQARVAIAEARGQV